MNFNLLPGENFTVSGKLNNVEKTVEVLALDDLKQDTLVSGENIKMINGESILGEGDISLLPTMVGHHMSQPAHRRQ